MKTSLILAICLALTAAANAATYSVYKASAAVPVNYTTVNSHGDTVIVKKTLSSRSLINLALGNASTTKPAKNIILAVGGPSNFSFSVTPTAPAQIIVWDTMTNTKLATIATVGSRNVIEQDSSAYKRVGVGPLTFVAGANPTNRITGGTLNMQGTLTRKPTPAGPKPTIKTTGGGTIGLVIDGTAITTGIVHKASISNSGLPLGSYVE